MNDILEQVLSRLQGVKKTATGWQALCPAHADQRASLSLSLGDDGRVLLFCHAGCGFNAICEALGIIAKELGPPHAEAIRRQVVATYDYRDQQGELLFQVCRTEPKAFFQRRPDGRGGWLNGLGGMKPVLYRLPQLVAAVASGETVYVVEGEKDAENLVTLGLAATTNPMGAGKWRPEYGDSLRGAHVVIVPDNDEPGRKHVRQVAQSVNGRVASLKVLELPGLPPKGDVSDWIAGGGTAVELSELVAACPVWECQPGAAAPRVDEEEEAEIATRPWPAPLDSAAFHGLAGDIVTAIEPHTEADPAALLFNTLTLFGNVIGRGARFLVEGTAHHMNLFCVLVGSTSKARKGSSLGRILPLFNAVDEDWVKHRVIAGLSSGEGLIWAVRDAIREVQEDKKTHELREVLVDAGVSDKRLVAEEQEFASTIRVLKRDGNTLSAVIRRAWDGATLSTLVKNSPARAVGAHVSILGHVTKEELVRYLDNNEAGNGFGNRFLWVCVRRSKCLPEGGRLLPEEVFADLVYRLNAAVNIAKAELWMDRSPEAREMWASIYPQLSEARPGLLGSMTARAEAQVLRLSSVYALLDQSPVVQVDHLLAALACWEYAEESARFIFGEALGDPVADAILQMIQNAGSAGVTKTDISQHFGKNTAAATINRGLTLLAELGLAKSEKHATGGRSVEKWSKI